MGELLAAFRIDPQFVAGETTGMQSVVLAKTARRQVLGVMNEFACMAEYTISTGRSDLGDLVGLLSWLANTIVGPVSEDDLEPAGPLAPGGGSPRRLVGRPVTTRPLYEC